MPKQEDTMDDVDADPMVSEIDQEIRLEEVKVGVEADMEDEGLDDRAKELLELALNFKPSQYSDEHRDPDASSYGGFQILDQELQTKLRSAGKELLIAAGRKILNG